MTQLFPNVLDSFSKPSAMALRSDRRRRLQEARAVTLLNCVAVALVCFAMAVSSRSAFAQTGAPEGAYLGNAEQMAIENGEYGGEYGGMGGPPQMSRRNASGASTQDLMSSQLQNMTSVFATADYSALTDPNAVPPVSSGPVLENEAVVAYAHGNHALAMKLYFGHIVAEYENAEEAMQMVSYSPLMKRPAWQIRWGVSYALRGDDVEPEPIQESSGGGRGQFPGMEGGMEMAMAPGGFSGQPGGRSGGRGRMEFEEDGGMEEEMMAMEMEMSMQEAMMSGMGASQMMGGMPRRQGMRPGIRGGVPAPVKPSEKLASLERSFLSPEVDEELTETMGLVATILGEEFDTRYGAGEFGQAMVTVDQGAGDTDSISPEFVELMQSSPEPLPMWRPNMVFVGKNHSADSIRAAREAGLDLLLHIDVSLKDIRGSFTQTVCQCRVYHVQSGKSLGRAKLVDSLEYEQKSNAREFDAREYVQGQLANLLGIIDKQAQTTELPALTPDIARRRVGQLLASGGEKNLRTLAEIRLFQMQQLLSDDEVLSAFDIVGGEDALQLIFGTESERLEIVRRWASGVADSDDFDS